MICGFGAGGGSSKIEFHLPGFGGIRKLWLWLLNGTKKSKAGLNFRHHGVRMPEAIPVFDDPHAVSMTDDESDPNEQRFVALGVGATARLLVVVYTYRGENIRIISARPAKPHEREKYYNEQQ